MSTDHYYPYQDGDVIVLGPEIFVAEDKSVICWRGENYVPQDLLFKAETQRDQAWRRLDENELPEEVLDHAKTRARLAELEAEVCDLLRQGLRAPHDGWRYKVERFLAEHDREADTA
jgi:hypothetical protein